jgi:WD40 repeat protein
LCRSAHSQREAKRWSAARHLAGHKSLVNAVAFSPDGKLVLTGSHDKTARLWPVSSGTQALVETAKATVPRCLTPAQRQRCHFPPAAPRWCYTNKLWPYDDQAKVPPAPPAWDERLLAAWDRVTAWTGSRGALAKP